jgi:hypothetical protein
MKPIKVNADYEITLFENKSPPKVINQSLEFLALYLENKPLVTDKHYTQKFLDHVTRISGSVPSFSAQKDFENWWGSLKNIPLEKKLNSKEFTAPFTPGVQIISDLSDLQLVQGQTYLAKNPFGMSGQNFLKFSKNQETELLPLLKKSKRLLIEPYLNRKKDFSHYVFSDGTYIAYENLVDDHFQYKGTIFRNLHAPISESLSFYHEIEKCEWDRFEKEFHSIRETMKREGATGGYSVDSFTYLEEGKLKIRTCSEINYRKTMGLVAWLLSKKYANDNQSSMLVLGHSLKAYASFEFIEERIKNLQGCLHLSPGDSRFEIFFIAASDLEKVKEKFQELKKLLPDGQFSVEI